MDRDAIARELGFSRITANSLDAVSDRDFALDYLFALANRHASFPARRGFCSLRLARNSDSSASRRIFHRQQPDAAKKKSRRVGTAARQNRPHHGALFALFTTLKGLPASYQRDLQEDKEPLFAAHDQIVAMLAIAAGALAATRFREARLREAAQDPALVATEVADYLVAQGIPFREAHEIVGKVLRAADQDGKSIREMPLDRLRQFSPVFGAELSTVLTLESALARRAVAGGTAPGAVRAALEDFTSRLARLEENP